MPVNSFFGRGELDDIIHAELEFLLDRAVNFDSPRPRLEIFCQAGRLFFLRGKFVVIVVMGDIVKRSDLLGRGESALLYAINFLPSAGAHGRRKQFLDA